MAAAIGGGGCFIALDGGRFGLPGCSLLLRLHRRARVLRGSGYGGGGARSLRPCCLTAGRFAIADTCSYRLPDGSAPLLPVLAVGRSRPLRSRAPRPVTSPSAVGRPDAPPSRGEPGTPRSARPASAVCLASRPAARFRRSPGGSPPPPPAAPASAAPPGGLAGGALRGGGVFEGGCGCFWPFSLWFTQAGVPIGAKRQDLLSVFPGQWNWPIAARSFGSVKRSEIGQKLAMGRQVPHRMGLGALAGRCRVGWRASPSASGAPAARLRHVVGPARLLPAALRLLCGDPGVSGTSATPLPPLTWRLAPPAAPAPPPPPRSAGLRRPGAVSVTGGGGRCPVGRLRLV